MGGSIGESRQFDINSLANEATEAGTWENGNGTKRVKRNRHCRQIKTIRCSRDGKYALVLCSDNSVLLYRLDNTILFSFLLPFVLTFARIS